MSFREISLSTLGRIVTGKTPATSNPAYFDGPYPFVTPSDLEWKTYYCKLTERTVNDEAKKAHGNQFIPADSVMVTCIGNTIGKCAISSCESLTNQQINTIIPSKNTNPRFVYYLLINNCEVVRGFGLGGGSATPIINKTAFSSIKVQVPPREAWNKIANILSIYDDLIENNRQRIKLLEDSVRQLYKEWFVRLRFPGHEQVNVVDGLPEGWLRSPLAVITQIIKRGITPSYDNDADWLVINQKCIRNGRLNTNLARRQSKEVKSDRVLRLGDVLINSTGEGTLGRVAQINEVIE